MSTRIYRTAYALLAWVIIITRYFQNVFEDDAGTVLAETVIYFSYFTIQTNLIAAIVMSLSVLYPASVAARASFRGAVVVYIVIVALVYHVVLADFGSQSGLELWLNHGLHTVLPALYVLDWVVFSKKTGLRATHAFKWLIFPVFYCAYTMIKGIMTSSYPYGFLDPAVSNWSRVSINILVLVCIFYVGGLLVVFLRRPDST